MRVLVVEDNLDIQANIADYLEDSFTLDFAYSGDQGLELALANEYDVIVLDIMLPGRSGLEVCAAYKRLQVCRRQLSWLPQGTPLMTKRQASPLAQMII